MRKSGVCIWYYQIWAYYTSAFTHEEKWKEWENVAEENKDNKPEPFHLKRRGLFVSEWMQAVHVFTWIISTSQWRQSLGDSEKGQMLNIADKCTCNKKRATLSVKSNSFCVCTFLLLIYMWRMMSND